MYPPFTMSKYATKEQLYRDKASYYEQLAKTLAANADNDKLGDDFGESMELQKLKALAEDVKQWSNCNQAWLDQSEDDPAAVVGHINEDGETYPVATINCDLYYAAQDSLKLALFYAAANPTAVLTLLAENQSLRQQLATVSDLLKEASGPMSYGNWSSEFRGRVEQMQEQLAATEPKS